MARQGERTPAERERDRALRQSQREGRQPDPPAQSRAARSAQPRAAQPAQPRAARSAQPRAAQLAQPRAAQPAQPRAAQPRPERPQEAPRQVKFRRTTAGRPASRKPLPKRPIRTGAAARASAPTAGRPRRSGRIRAAVVVLLVLAAAVIWFLVSLFQPFAGSGTGQVMVTIPPRASSGQVADLLARDGVVDSSFFFGLRAKLAGTSFRAGTFTLAHGMSYGDALHVLTTASGVGPVTNVTIIPGKSRWQLDRILKKQHVPGSYLADTVRSPILNPRSYGAPASTPSLEGFLYPDTYQVKRPLRIPDLVAEQLTEFKRQFSAVNLSYARQKNLTAYDVLKVASLVEAEAAEPSDLPRVASVIYNRLRLGMTLGFDTTLAYATHDYSGNLTASELALNSPYNTRTHVGLPPTPIDSPGLNAIQAAAHPARTNYLYFIVKVCGNGSLSFTNSYSQFLAWSAAYSQAEARRGVNGAAFCHRG